jgi:hypothetical protein
MGNYDNATQVQDATYALLNALDDSDKSIIDATTYYRPILYNKYYDDAAALDVLPDTPCIYTGLPIQIIALLFITRTSILADLVDYVMFRAKRYINGVFVETMAELKTDTYSITGFVPALLSPISNVPYIINTNDCLSISIDKAGAGKIVGSGVWQLVGKLV